MFSTAKTRGLIVKDFRDLFCTWAFLCKLPAVIKVISYGSKDFTGVLTFHQTAHLGKASAQLHMSPSTLSRRISRLEEEVGVLLCERHSTPIQITPEGELFAHYAEHSLQAWQSLKRH